MTPEEKINAYILANPDELEKYWADNPDELEKSINTHTSKWAPYVSDAVNYGETGGVITYWNPDTKKVETLDVSDMDYRTKKQYHDKLGFYVNADGDMVYGIKPGSLWRPPEWEGTWQSGEGPAYPETTSDLVLGQHDWNPGYDGPVVIGGWEGGDEYGYGSEFGDLDGDRERTEHPFQEEIDDGRGGFVTDPTDPFQNTYGGPTINWGDPTGVQGVDPGYEVDTPFDIDPLNPANHFGFENSTNEKFYQIQAAAQRARGFRNAMREQAARNVAANQPDPVAGDPWAWAGGSDQFTPTAGDGSGGGTGGGGGDVASGEWYMNPNFLWEPGTTSNADLLRMYSTLSAFDNYDVNAWLNDGVQDGSYDWGKFNPNDPNIEYGGANPFINGNPMIDTLFQNMWLRNNAPVNPYTAGSQTGSVSMSPTQHTGTGTNNWQNLSAEEKMQRANQFSADNPLASA